jgi:hypothetical protein
MLRPTFDDPEYQNDFAAWAWRSLHDSRLAERLAIIDPSHYPDIEDLRREVIDVIQERLAESEYIPWAKTGQRFAFIRSQIVVFDTGKRVSHPLEMAELIPTLSLGSIFYHFIDARRRTKSGRSDFVEWLHIFENGKHRSLIKKINEIDPYFTTLSQLRKDLSSVFQTCTVEGESL